MKNDLLISLLAFFVLSACQRTAPVADVDSSGKKRTDTSTALPQRTNIYPLKTGKAFQLTEYFAIIGHQTNLTIKPIGFKNGQIENIEQADSVQRVEIADLNNDGFEEIYIFTGNKRTGHRHLIGFASIRDQYLVPIRLMASPADSVDSMLRGNPADIMQYYTLRPTDTIWQLIRAN